VPCVESTVKFVFTGGLLTERESKEKSDDAEMMLRQTLLEEVRHG